MTFAARLDDYFAISARGSSVRTELEAGLVTFLAMSYIMVVNPTLLEAAGMTWNHTFTATVISAAVATGVMALYARYPIALAPGMGINAFFTYTAVVLMGYTWAQALGVVFVAAVLFLALSVSGLRERLVAAIPADLRYAIAAGIGGFLLLIGLNGSHIIVSSPATLVTLGDLTDPAVLLALFGIALTIVLFVRGWKTAIFFGVLITALVGMALGIVALPDRLLAVPELPDVGAFAGGLAAAHWDLQYFIVIFSFLLVTFFDSTGTVMSLAHRAGMMDEDGRLKDGHKAFLADSVGALTGAVVGTPPVTSYAESTVGIESGGRTGLMALTVAGLFLLALFLWPILSVVSYPCTVAALVIVACLMLTTLRLIDWERPEIALTAVVTVMGMMLTYSITNGIGLGLIVYCLAMLAAGKGRSVSRVMYLLAAVYLGYFAVTAVFY